MKICFRNTCPAKPILAAIATASLVVLSPSLAGGDEVDLSLTVPSDDSQAANGLDAQVPVGVSAPREDEVSGKETLSETGLQEKLQALSEQLSLQTAKIRQLEASLSSKCAEPVATKNDKGIEELYVKKMDDHWTLKITGVKPEGYEVHVVRVSDGCFYVTWRNVGKMKNPRLIPMEGERWNLGKLDSSHHSVTIFDDSGPRTFNKDGALLEAVEPYAGG